MNIWILDGEKMEEAIRIMEAIYETSGDGDKDRMIICLEQMYKVREMAIRIKTKDVLHIDDHINLLNNISNGTKKRRRAHQAHQ